MRDAAGLPSFSGIGGQNRIELGTAIRKLVTGHIMESISRHSDVAYGAGIYTHKKEMAVVGHLNQTLVINKKHLTDQPWGQNA